jgi:hypothetical protein
MRKKASQFGGGSNENQIRKSERKAKSTFLIAWLKIVYHGLLLSSTH